MDHQLITTGARILFAPLAEPSIALAKPENNWRVFMLSHLLNALSDYNASDNWNSAPGADTAERQAVVTACVDELTAILASRAA
jgi:hypothetical protein